MECASFAATGTEITSVYLEGVRNDDAITITMTDGKYMVTAVLGG
jgi:hypothetical protein